MRYFFIEGNYTPKHCIYGPRPREAIFFEPWEWFAINDTLYKNQRERAVMEMYAAKEQKKKDMSHDMTKNWQNTLAVSESSVGTSDLGIRPNRIELSAVNDANSCTTQTIKNVWVVLYFSF